MSQHDLLKYLLAASLSLSLPALADTANVSVYGLANVSYDFINTGTASNGTKGTDIDKISSNASRVGFKGAEEVGDGLSINWQIESLIALDNAGGTFATRNSFAGLSSKSYGSVLLGRYDTPYKIITRKLDNFSDTIADNRTLFGTVKSLSAGTSFVTKQPDVFSYTTPNLNGFVASFARVNLTETATKASDKKDNATSFSAAYDNGTLYGALGYELHQLDTVRVGGTENAWNVALGYTLDDLSFGAAYESTTDTLGKSSSLTTCSALANGADCFGHSAAYLTAKYQFGSGAVKLAYTKVERLAAAANTGADHATIGYDHRLSKRSTVYALYTVLTNQSSANYSLGGAAWSSGLTSSIGAGSTLSALSFGVKQAF